MKKKKGFTLVELLAVIVILAVILVIAVPRIMDTINNSKEGTLMSSAKLIASQAEKKYVENQVLGINDVISCDDVVKTTDDYDYCDITFDSDGKASVSIIGKDKFEGMAICDGTKTEASISDNCYTDEACFAYQVEANEVLVTGYAYEDSACGSDVWVPDMIDDFPVVAIADYAFTTFGDEVSAAPVYNDYIDYKVVPLKNNIYNVEAVPIAAAGSAGIGITSIKLPKTIEYIGANAFRGNGITGGIDFSNLTNLTTIGEYAFAYNEITSLILPKTIIVIGGDAFMENEITGTLDLSKLTSLITIGNYAFRNNNISILKLPTSVTAIGTHAFMENEIIGTLDLSKLTSLITIGNYAFSTNDISVLKLPISVTTIGNGAFSTNEITGTLDFSDLTNLTTIGARAFVVNSIKSVILPSSVTNVEESAFASNSLEKVVVGNVNLTFGTCAFGNANELDSTSVLPASYPTGYCQK